MKLQRLILCFILVSMASFVSAQAATSRDTKSQKEEITVQSVAAPPNNDGPLIPIPEPSAGSLVLLSVGGLGLSLVMRRQA